jgi:membrane protein implicated in regulation of membrane protease activity
MNGLDLAFKVCAIFGGALFVIRLVLQFFAGMGDADLDGVGESSDADLSGTDASFRLLSMQGITAFFMIFGLAGLALLGSEVGATLAVIGAFVAGSIAVWVVAWIFQGMRKLQSKGGVLNLQNAVGKEGSVYLTIPANGAGKVSVVVQNRLGEFEAISESKEELKTGTLIKVVGVTGDKVLIVAKKEAS